MNKLKFLKANEVAVILEESIYCDFCGDHNKEVFTSQYDMHEKESKNETQICKDCVRQLFKML